jgi:hypothetical protein
MNALPALDRLAMRVEALAAVEAIECLKARYWRAVDRGRPEEIEACLLPDAVIDFEGLPRFETRNGFLEIVRAGAAAQGCHMHHGHNPDITVTDRDSAAGTWDIFYHGIDMAARTIVQLAGIYHDTYVRRDGSWWIATTIMRRTSMTVQSIGTRNAPRVTRLGNGASP